MIFFSAITATATVVIAYYAWQNHQLTQQLKRSAEAERESNREFRQQTSDLYQALVITGAMTAPGGVDYIDRTIGIFKSHYKGKTPIHLIEKGDT